MSYAAIMVYVDAENASRDTIRFAADLAARFNATLVGVSALLLQSPIAADGIAISGVTEVDIAEAENRLAAAAELFKDAAGPKVKVEWRQAPDLPIEVLTRAARAADLVVIAQGPTLGVEYSTPDPGTTILRAGRPVLIVPKGVTSLRAEHIVVGWKETREARRALQDALPLLHEASRVTIVEVCDAGEEAAAQAHLNDVAAYLARHRIKVNSRVALQQRGSSAADLIEHARETGADLIVTGAYGHSRLGEWVFGGMTRDLLKSSPMCCLMSH